jgi:chromosomal replication initiator protein
MKSDVFNQYVERVTDLFKISNEEFFSKSKKRYLVDARYLVYFMCSKRPMQIAYIQKYMNDNGYDIVHSSVIHGIENVEEKVKVDKDYQAIVKELEKAVFI